MNDSPGRQKIAGRHPRAWQDYWISFRVLGIDNLDLRTQGYLTATGRLDDYAVGQAGDIIHFLAHGNAIFNILITNPSLHFGDKRHRVWIPVRQYLPCLDLSARLYMQACTVGHLVALEFNPLGIDNNHFRMSVNHHIDPALITDQNLAFKKHFTRHPGFNIGLCRSP